MSKCHNLSSSSATGSGSGWDVCWVQTHFHHLASIINVSEIFSLSFVIVVFLWREPGRHYRHYYSQQAAKQRLQFQSHNWIFLRTLLGISVVFVPSILWRNWTISTRDRGKENVYFKSNQVVFLLQTLKYVTQLMIYNFWISFLLLSGRSQHFFLTKVIVPKLQQDSNLHHLHRKKLRHHVHFLCWLIGGCFPLLSLQDQ